MDNIKKWSPLQLLMSTPWEWYSIQRQLTDNILTVSRIQEHNLRIGTICTHMEMILIQIEVLLTNQLIIANKKALFNPGRCTTQGSLYPKENFQPSINLSIKILTIINFIFKINANVDIANEDQSNISITEINLFKNMIILIINNILL